MEKQTQRGEGTDIRSHAKANGRKQAQVYHPKGLSTLLCLGDQFTRIKISASSSKVHTGKDEYAFHLSTLLPSHIHTHFFIEAQRDNIILVKVTQIGNRLVPRFSDFTLCCTTSLGEKQPSKPLSTSPGKCQEL